MEQVALVGVVCLEQDKITLKINQVSLKVSLILYKEGNLGYLEDLQPILEQEQVHLF